MSKLQVKNVLVLGAGKVGSTVADMIAEYHRIPVTLADQRAGAPSNDPLVRQITLNVEDEAALAGTPASFSMSATVLPTLPAPSTRTFLTCSFDILFLQERAAAP